MLLLMTDGKHNNFTAHTFVLSKQSVLEIALMLHITCGYIK